MAKRAIKKALGVQGTIDFGGEPSSPIVVTPISESGVAVVQDGVLKTPEDAVKDKIEKEVNSATGVGSSGISAAIKKASQPSVDMPELTFTPPSNEQLMAQEDITPESQVQQPNKWVTDYTALAKEEAPNVISYGIEGRQNLLQRSQSPNSTYRGNIQQPVDYIDEPLGVQQYFPEIGRSTAVGSYSRKTLGSGNIYVAGGGVLPFGLLDARKRSLQRQAQQIAALNKAKDYNIDTAPQFQELIAQEHWNDTQDFMDKTGGNYSLLEDPRSDLYPEFQARQKSWVDRAKQVKDIDAQARELVKQLNEDAEKGVVANIDEQSKYLQQWLNPSTEFINKILSGEEDLGKWSEKFKSYKAITPWADATANDLELDAMPLNTKNMTSFEAAKGLQDAIRKGAGLGYDKYITGIKEFANIEKIEQIVDAAFNDQNFYKGQFEGTPEQQQAMLNKQKQDAVRAIISRMADKVTFKQDTVANDALEEKRLAFDKKQYEEGKITKYSFIKSQGDASKEYWNQLMSDPKLTLNQRVAKMSEWATKNGMNLDVAKTNQLGTPAFEIVMGDKEKNHYQGTNLSSTYVDLPTRNGKSVSVPLSYVLTGVAKTKHNVDPNSDAYKKAIEDLNDIKASMTQNGSFNFKPGTRYHALYSQETYTNPKTGQKTIVSIPLQKSTPSNQIGMSTQIVDNFNGVVYQKREKDGTISYENKTLRNNYYTRQNLDDPAVQIGYDNTGETSDANRNPNVPR